MELNQDKIDTLAEAYRQRLDKLKRAVHINTNSKAVRRAISGRADELASTAGLMSYFFFENDLAKRDEFMTRCGFSVKGAQRGEPNFNLKAIARVNG